MNEYELSPYFWYVLFDEQIAKVKEPLDDMERLISSLCNLCSKMDGDEAKSLPEKFKLKNFEEFCKKSINNANQLIEFLSNAVRSDIEFLCLSAYFMEAKRTYNGRLTRTAETADCVSEEAFKVQRWQIKSEKPSCFGINKPDLCRSGKSGQESL